MIRNNRARSPACVASCHGCPDVVGAYADIEDNNRDVDFDLKNRLASGTHWMNRYPGCIEQ